MDCWKIYQTETRSEKNLSNCITFEVIKNNFQNFII